MMLAFKIYILINIFNCNYWNKKSYFLKIHFLCTVFFYFQKSYFSYYLSFNLWISMWKLDCSTKLINWYSFISNAFFGDKDFLLLCFIFNTEMGALYWTISTKPHLWATALLISVNFEWKVTRQRGCIWLFYLVSHFSQALLTLSPICAIISSSQS